MDPIKILVVSSRVGIISDFILILMYHVLFIHKNIENEMTIIIGTVYIDVRFGTDWNDVTRGECE